MNLFSKGTVLAGAVAALFACGGAAPDEATTPATGEPAAADPSAPGASDPAAAHGPATAEQVKCTGINECKGSAECAAADGTSSCKGQNACKGKGWVSVSAEDCTTKGGTVVQ